MMACITAEHSVTAFVPVQVVPSRRPAASRACRRGGLPAARLPFGGLPAAPPAAACHARCRDEGMLEAAGTGQQRSGSRPAAPPSPAAAWLGRCCAEGMLEAAGAGQHSGGNSSKLCLAITGAPPAECVPPDVEAALHRPP